MSFVFSLGVGYQRLESHINAAEASIKVYKVQSDLDKDYIKSDLNEIKNKLDEIERFLREKK